MRDMLNDTDNGAEKGGKRTQKLPCTSSHEDHKIFNVKPYFVVSYAWSLMTY